VSARRREAFHFAAAENERKIPVVLPAAQTERKGRYFFTFPSFIGSQRREGDEEVDEQQKETTAERVKDLSPLWLLVAVVVVVEAIVFTLSFHTTISLHFLSRFSRSPAT
jgi:hypothetical protein